MSTATQSLERGNHDFAVTKTIEKARLTEPPDKELMPTTLPSISKARPPESIERASPFVGAPADLLWKDLTGLATLPDVVVELMFATR